MDYEEKYKEALERAKRLRDLKYQTMNAKRVVEEIFPGLAESEDERNERIRKAILGLSYLDGIEPILTKCSVTRSDIRSYLEKQKESLHVSGTWKDNPDSFTDEDERTYNEIMEFFKMNEKRCIVDNSYTRWIAWLEKQKEQESIPLMNGDADLYFDNWFQQRGQVTSRQCFKEGIKYAQRLQKEQKPAEWCEFDKCALEDAICATDLLGNDESFNKSNPNLAKTFRVVKDWLKSLPERFSLQPKVEWSEEDEKMLNLTKTQFRILQSHLSHTHSERMSDMEYSSQLLQIEKCVSWLDIRLKSLRNQPHWKPSEEQMCYLKKVYESYDFCDGERDALESLYNGLKKLGVKEEPEYYQHFDSDC